MAEEDGADPFNIEDVAKIVADKLERRHPHVFGDVKVSGTDEVLANWEVQKAEEKGRTSAIDGVPLAQPALPLANKLIYRADKFKYDLPVDHPVEVDIKDEADLGNILLGIIDQAAAKGLDPEAALRAATKEYIERLRQYEAEKSK